MSFDKKYLKYKSKYLALKAQVNNLQLNNTKKLGQNGGSFYGKKIEELDLLSQTPLMTEEISYKLKGGSYSNFNTDYKKLATLLNDSENIYTTEVSEFSQSAGSDKEENEGTNSESAASQTASQTQETSQTGSESAASQTVSQTQETSQTGSESASESASQTGSESTSESVVPQARATSDNASESASDNVSETATPLTDTPVLQKSEEQTGGKKAKSHKKYFFDDSDIRLESTTTDSDLSSLDTDTTDDSDADL
jgi:hypothetical protein